MLEKIRLLLAGAPVLPAGFGDDLERLITQELAVAAKASRTLVERNQYLEDQLDGSSTSALEQDLEEATAEITRLTELLEGATVEAVEEETGIVEMTDALDEDRHLGGGGAVDPERMTDAGHSADAEDFS